MSSRAIFTILLTLWPLVPITWYGVVLLRRPLTDQYTRGKIYLLLAGSYAVVGLAQQYLVQPFLKIHHL